MRVVFSTHCQATRVRSLKPLHLPSWMFGDRQNRHVEGQCCGSPLGHFLTPGTRYFCALGGVTAFKEHLTKQPSRLVSRIDYHLLFDPKCFYCLVLLPSLLLPAPCDCGGEISPHFPSLFTKCMWFVSMGCGKLRPLVSVCRQWRRH